MSQADIETLRGLYEAFSRGDRDAAFRVAHPDVELKVGDLFSPSTYHGPEEIRRFLEDLLEPLEEVIIQPERFFERGDRIAVIVRWRVRTRGSSAVAENTNGHLWTMRGGKVARWEVFLDPSEVLEAAGLSS